MKRSVLVVGLLLFCLAVALGGCATRSIHNKEMWYTFSVPHNWLETEKNMFANKQGDSIRILRIRDPAPLENLARSTLESMKIEVPGFSMENEEWPTIRGRKSWMMVGTYKPQKTDEVTLIKVIIDAGKYKYLVDVTTPSEHYNQRKLTLHQMVQSFSIKIPEI